MATLHSRPHGKHPEIHNEELFRIWRHFHLLKWQQREILGRIPCALRKDHQLGALCSKRSTFSATSGDSVQLYYASLSKAHLLLDRKSAYIGGVRDTIFYLSFPTCQLPGNQPKVSLAHRKCLVCDLASSPNLSILLLPSLLPLWMNVTPASQAPSPNLQIYFAYDTFVCFSSN